MSKNTLIEVIKETKEIILEEHNVQNLKKIFKNIETIDSKCKTLKQHLDITKSYINDSILLDNTIKHLKYLLDCKKSIPKSELKYILKLIKDRNILDWENLPSYHYSKSLDYSKSLK